MKKKQAAHRCRKIGAARRSRFPAGVPGSFGLKNRQQHAMLFALEKQGGTAPQDKETS